MYNSIYADAFIWFPASLGIRISRDGSFSKAWHSLWKQMSRHVFRGPKMLSLSLLYQANLTRVCNLHLYLSERTAVVSSQYCVIMFESSHGAVVGCLVMECVCYSTTFTVTSLGLQIDECSQIVWIFAACLEYLKHIIHVIAQIKEFSVEQLCPHPSC